jgi:hypothetical protein
MNLGHVKAHKASLWSWQIDLMEANIELITESGWLIDQ